MVVAGAAVVTGHVAARAACGALRGRRVVGAGAGVVAWAKAAPATTTMAEAAANFFRMWVVVSPLHVCAPFRHVGHVRIRTQTISQSWHF